MKNQTRELRNTTGRLLFVYCSDTGTFEHLEKGCLSRIIVSPGTPFQLGHIQEEWIQSRGAMELRDANNRLIAKYYPEKGVIETLQKKCYSFIFIPPGTLIKFDPGKKPSTR